MISFCKHPVQNKPSDILYLCSRDWRSGLLWEASLSFRSPGLLVAPPISCTSSSFLQTCCAQVLAVIPRQIEGALCALLLLKWLCSGPADDKLPLMSSGFPFNQIWLPWLLFKMTISEIFNSTGWGIEILCWLLITLLLFISKQRDLDFYIYLQVLGR